MIKLVAFLIRWKVLNITLHHITQLWVRCIDTVSHHCQCHIMMTCKVTSFKQQSAGKLSELRPLVSDGLCPARTWWTLIFHLVSITKVFFQLPSFLVLNTIQTGTLNMMLILDHNAPLPGIYIHATFPAIYLYRNLYLINSYIIPASIGVPSIKKGP